MRIDAPLLEGLPEYGKKDLGKAVRVSRPPQTKGGTGVSESAEVIVPIDLKTGSADQRFKALERYETQESMTGAIVWVMKNDPDYEVRRKAWRVIRARWRHGTGVASEHEAAAVWLSSNGSVDLRTEAIVSIGDRSSSLNNAKRHLGDGDAGIRLVSAEAVAEVAGRTDQGAQAREILADQVSKENDQKVAKQIGKLISEL